MTDIVRCDSCGVTMAKGDETSTNILERGRFTDTEAPMQKRKFGMALHINPVTKVRGGTGHYGYSITYSHATGEPIKVDAASTAAIYIDGYRSDPSGHLCPRCRARLLRYAAAKMIRMADDYDRRKSLYIEEIPKAVPHGREKVNVAFHGAEVLCHGV